MAKLNQISPEFVEKLFKHWSASDFAEEDMDKLSPLISQDLSVEQKRLELRDLLYDIVVKNLPIPQQKKTEDTDSEDLTKTLKEELELKHEAEEYSLIYCRYLGVQQHQTQELADITRMSPRTVRRYIQKGFSKISLALKTQLNDASPKKKPAGYLPIIEADHIVGIEPLTERIHNWLNHKNPPRAVSIEGLGGIGKTLLARQLLEERYQADLHDGYVWVSTRQESLSFFSGQLSPVENAVSTLDDMVSRLAQNLGQSHLAGFSTQEIIAQLQRYSKKNNLLIIIDNLETAEDVDSVVPALLQLTGSSVIIFTSRKSLGNYPNVRILRVPELSFEHSYKLVQDEINRLDLQITADEENIRQLFKLTGGIPLALKLATAQLDRIALADIIHQLRLGKKNSYSMYTYIYRQAWKLLSDTGKKLLLAMPLVSPDGEDREWICLTGNLTDDEFEAGVAELRKLSLIEFSGSLERCLYRVHRLTISFLQTDILKGWETENSQ